EAGALACLVEADGAESFDFDDDERIVAIQNLKTITGPLASAFLGAPSERLKVVAVTGTNGKTSSTWWIAQAMSALGQRSGIIGTLGVGEPPSHGRPAAIDATGLTTPDPVTLQRAFKRFVDAGYAGCALEASSIGIVEHRLAGTHIDVGVFTNFTQDHLDFHGSMTTYWQAKSQLFHWRGLNAAVLNIDDEQGKLLARQLNAGPLDVWTVSTRQAARLQAQGITYDQGGLGFEVVEDEERAPVRSALIGDYNVSNLLGVIAALRALGISLDDATRVCAELTPVPGRMQRVRADAAVPEVVVDYAHTPDALEKALTALQPLARARGGELWCVFGCGGNRDPGKRPLMGALAQRLAQHTIVTSDNPRHEEPRAILSQIAAGMSGDNKPWIIEDRRDAIRRAVDAAGASDVILVAGKGHEDYQDIAGVKHPFDDVVEAQLALEGAAA
ncbi:MAG TPA: UDP-N-acetylmuramoyl-L-alanyl-D-glutamate--2,6-diaminopimelate ligase, partial [Albitalea sp.]|nr:UDP-N-acetylmuramoyl-L-alanyl-D-glutamate--2,6-diaminopimelate ligase [Albitalea sp.]